MKRAVPFAGAFFLWLAFAGRAACQVPEVVYRGELLAYPGPWGYQIGKSGIILVTDEELETLAADPNRLLNLSLGRAPRSESLRQICERARARGETTLLLAFDHFFAQYRSGQDRPRRLMPDMDEYIQRIAVIGRFAQGSGLGLELSLLSPLEVGKTYAARTGESGLWMHYRKGLRDPKTGAFSVQMWRQERWANNKGPVDIEPAGLRVFAFRETPVPGTPYRVVEPTSLTEITSGSQVETYDNLTVRAGDFRARRIRVYGIGALPRDDLNRVLVVQQYKTPEMDYFSPKALPFLTGVIDKYSAAGVKLNGLYSDEMHIQGDWAYFSHHDLGEFALRYVSDGLAKRYADLYGAEYRDFAKYLIYFVYGQEDYAHDLSARQGVMHVVGATPEAIRRTALFRARYYHLLQDGVVDLFVQAKRYAERKMGRRLDARYHATWAESPTIDRWDVGRQNQPRNQYEYTSNFVWSNTVQQAATACYDYFKWGDFLTGNGNDHCEGGWLDRNYVGLALACSTGILNDVPYAYAGHWGMPPEISRRRDALESVYGVGRPPMFGLVEEMQHRDVDVLMLYPLDLVAVEERFGSWTTQYGYANSVTAAKLLERGAVKDNAIEMAGRRFTTLVATFEPFPSQALLAFMKKFAEQGGCLVWAGPPPVLTSEGDSALEAWQSIFRVDYQPDAAEGIIAPGKLVTFEGALAAVKPQVILTDLLVDHIYPVRPWPGTDVAARVKTWVVGTRRSLPGGGSATFLGYRPRDDQSRSLGYDARNWFEALDALGAYPPSGRFSGVNDNTEQLSRTGEFLATRFPNGAVAIAPHLRELEEDWEGGFARNQENDRRYLERNPPPSDAIRLKDFHVNGHTVTYDGAGALAFRVGTARDLVAFAGNQAQRIAVDGRETVFADRTLDQIAWAPVAEERRLPDGALLQVLVRGEGTVRIPAAGLPPSVQLVVEGPRPGSRGAVLPSRLEAGALVFRSTPSIAGRWLFAVPQ
jgi:hypothetical protein